MDHIREDIKKQPTNLKPFPTTTEQQMVADLFGVSVSLAGETFIKVTHVLIAQMYDTFVVLSKIMQNGKLNLKTS